MASNSVPHPGERLREIRHNRRWSQRRLAAYLGCSKAMVTLMETRTSAPGRTLANRIQALLGIPSSAWDESADLLPQDLEPAPAARGARP